MKCVILTMCAAGWAMAGCSSDDKGQSDSAGADAAVVETSCSGQRAVFGSVTNLETLEPVADVVVEEVGVPDNRAASTLEGEALLCVPPDSSGQLVASGGEMLVRRDTYDADAVRLLAESGIDYPLGVLDSGGLFSIYYFQLGSQEDLTKTTVFLTVLTPSGEPATGAFVRLDEEAEHEGIYSRDENGKFGFEQNEMVIGGGQLLVANVTGEAGSTLPLTVQDDCTGPSEIILEPGGLAGAVFVCE